MNLPLVSICIPTYNGEQFIVEAMESAIKQNYGNLEIVVSGDASTDETLLLVERFRPKTLIPIHIYHHEPKSIGDNWNNCIVNSNGEFIKFLFQDDLLRPGCIERLVKIMDQNKELGMVSCKRTICIENKESQWANEWLFKYGDLQQKLNLQNVELNILDKKIFKHREFCKDPYNKIGEPSAVLFRRNIVYETGLFRSDLRQILDLEFYYRVLKNYKIAVINEKLVEFRLHSAQASQNKSIDYKEEYNLFRKIMFIQFFKYLNTKEKFKLLKEATKWIRIPIGLV